MNQRRAHALVKVCGNCPVCRHAHRHQRRLALAFVKRVEGRKSHEPKPLP